MAVGESELMAALLVGGEKVTQLINRCTIYELLYLSSEVSGPSTLAMENLTTALTALYLVVLRFLARAKNLYDKGSVSRTLGSVLGSKVLKFVDSCKDLETQVDTEARILDRIQDREARNLDRIQNREARNLDRIQDREARNLDRIQDREANMKLKSLFEDLRSPILRVDARVSALSDEYEVDKRNKILFWVSDIPYEEIHYVARKGWTKGTGKWLLNHERHVEWRASSASTILWLHGMRKCV